MLVVVVCVVRRRISNIIVEAKLGNTILIMQEIIEKI
jgi:hypothetical protein